MNESREDVLKGCGLCAVPVVSRAKTTGGIAPGEATHTAMLKTISQDQHTGIPRGGARVPGLGGGTGGAPNSDYLWSVTNNTRNSNSHSRGERASEDIQRCGSRVRCEDKGCNTRKHRAPATAASGVYRAARHACTHLIGRAFSSLLRLVRCRMCVV